MAEEEEAAAGKAEAQAAPAQDNNAILNVFRQELGSNVVPVMVNSLGREVVFREVSVEDQKTLSKTTISNESRRDVVYDVQCSLVNHLCTERGFDVYKLTEFDRIRILMEIYQSNYFRNNVTYKCENCGFENHYTLDFSKIVERLDGFDLKDKVFSAEDRNRVYNFTLNWPNVRAVSNFYRSYYRRYANSSKKEQEVLDSMGSIDYVDLYIRQIELIPKANPAGRQVADLSLMSYNQIEQLISMLPQGIVFSDETGVLKFITTEFIEALNNVFSYEKCAQCGHETTEGMGSLGDFF